MAKQQPKKGSSLSSNMASSGRMGMSGSPFKQATPKKMVGTMKVTKLPSKVVKTTVKSAPKAIVKPTAKPTARKPIALQEVRVTAPRDSVDLGRGTSQKRYSMDDVRKEVKNNPKLYPNKTVDTTNSKSVTQTTSGKDNQAMLQARLNARKNKSTDGMMASNTRKNK